MNNTGNKRIFLNVDRISSRKFGDIFKLCLGGITSLYHPTFSMMHMLNVRISVIFKLYKLWILRHCIRKKESRSIPRSLQEIGNFDRPFILGILTNIRG